MYIVGICLNQKYISEPEIHICYHVSYAKKKRIQIVKRKRVNQNLNKLGTAYYIWFKSVCMCACARMY